jgi:hypothetical protein
MSSVPYELRPDQLEAWLDVLLSGVVDSIAELDWPEVDEKLRVFHNLRERWTEEGLLTE